MALAETAALAAAAVQVQVVPEEKERSLAAVVALADIQGKAFLAARAAHMAAAAAVAVRRMEQLEMGEQKEHMVVKVGQDQMKMEVMAQMEQIQSD